jgi:chemotaxis protein CheD
MRPSDQNLALAPAVVSLERQAVYLYPGDLFATRRPTAVKTILGSCISVCLWDDVQRIGGMNHFLLPYGRMSADCPGRFGSVAIPLLIQAMHDAGAVPSHVRAKLFGGSAMIAGITTGSAHIGLQNQRLASELLDRAGIPVVNSDVGGAKGRKLVFNTDDGSVAVWEL